MRAPARAQRASLGAISQKVFTPLRLALAIGLFALLIQSIGLDQIRTSYSYLHPFYLAVVYCILMLDTVIRAYTWGRLLRTRKVYLPFTETVYVFVVGRFFGSFIPSSFGTDAARAFLAARRTGIKAQDSASAIVALNLVSLLALCIIALGSSPILLSGPIDRGFLFVIVLVCLAYIALLPFLIKGWLPFGYVVKRFPYLRRSVLSRIEGLSEALWGFTKHRGVLVAAVGIASVSQALGILIVYAISLSLGLDVPIGLLLTFMPVIALSRIVPISIAGFGAEQGVFVYLFSQAGVPAAEAFLVSLILSVANVSFASLGGLIYVAESLRRLPIKSSRR